MNRRNEGKKLGSPLKILILGLLTASVALAQTPPPPAAPAATPTSAATTPSSMPSLPAITPPPSQLTPPVPAVRPPEEAVAHKAVEKEEAESYGKSRGLLGPVTFGPSVGILGIPQPFQFALQLKYSDWLGGQVTYLYLPDLTISNVKVGLTGYDARLRLFPFRGAFYIGAAVVGKQKIKGSKTQTISGVPVTANVEVESKFLTPQLGWRWQWHSGFFMGLDLGWQLNRNANTTVTTDAPTIVQAQPDYTTLVNDVKKIGNDYGNKALPSFTLLQFGFML